MSPLSGFSILVHEDASRGHVSGDTDQQVTCANFGTCRCVLWSIDFRYSYPVPIFTFKHNELPYSRAQMKEVRRKGRLEKYYTITLSV
jgi:hypothetical protein